MRKYTKNTTKYEIFFAGLPPRTRPGAAAPDPAWGYRPRPLVLRPPPIEHPRRLPRGRRHPGLHKVFITVSPHIGDMVRKGEIMINE